MPLCGQRPAEVMPVLGAKTPKCEKVTENQRENARIDVDNSYLATWHA